ncbi:hypothetical protein [Haliangium sp.]|uniref:hypothetical protein n=1 Tax=Haliangium sp. TaxID=2663208 RepID=UPI003D0F796D
MGATVELIYQYRQLVGRCDAGTGLDFDEIDTLNSVESQLPPQPPIEHDDWYTGETSEAIPAVLRGYRLNDDVDIVNLGPLGCVCRRAPFAEEGTTVEVVVEREAPAVSYRFKAEVRWMQDDGDDFALGLAFVGVPLQVRYSTSRERTATASPEAQVAA